MPAPASLARRSLVSLTWNTAANLITLPVSFVQIVLLARLLPVEYFGIAAGMNALANMAWAVLEMGFNAAFLHRSAETEDEAPALAVFFTLRLITSLAWTTLLVLVALLALDDLRRMALLVIAVAGGALRVINVAQVALVRRVQHRRLALLDIAQTLAVFTLAVWIAARSGSIWALLVSPLVQVTLFFVALFIWRPVWQVRLSLEATRLRYYLDYARRAWLGVFLGQALEHIDDLWTNLYLGDLALGYYSRAYRFATYPSVVLAEPINALTLGMYAELKHDRLRLSRAFFQINALMVRSSFGLVGLMVAGAPYFIVLLLGDKWLPMLTAFRLLVVYALLQPLKLTVAHVLWAGGQPERVSWARAWQLLALLVGLFGLGWRWGIVGVALAVDAMLLVGLALLLRDARRVVDFSLLRLFMAPALALAAGIAAAALVLRLPAVHSSPWAGLLLVGGAFSAGYAVLLLALERGALFKVVREVWVLVNRDSNVGADKAG